MPSPFKTLGAVLCLVFALCFSAPNAYGDSFTPIFTTSTCSGICALPTAADVTFPSPTSINVTFAGLTQFVSIPAGDASGDIYTWNAAAIPAGGNLGFFLGDLTNGTGFNTFSCGGGTINGLVLSCGTLTFTPVATPEPSSLALMLSGVGLVFALRKRSANLQN
jgi:hypothetical protein